MSSNTQLPIVKLLAEVRNGNLTTVQEQINKYGFPSSKKRKNTYTLLLKALKLWHRDIAIVLLKAECAVYDNLALELAVEHEDKEIVNLILERRSVVDIKLKNGKTLLQRVSEFEDTSIFFTLLNHVKRIDSQDNEGNTILHSILENGGPIAIFNAVLDKGIDVNIPNDEGKTALHLATKICKSEIVNILLKHNADINAQDICGKTALHFLFENRILNPNDLEIAEILLSKGLSLNIQDTNGQTPLHYAVKNNIEFFISFLISCDVDVNIQDHWGDTALHTYLKTIQYHEFSSQEIVKIVKLFLSKGVDVNICNYKSCSVLHILCNFSDGTMENNQDPIALSKAADKSSVEIAEILLSNGAALDVHNNNGEFPLHLSVKHKMKSTALLYLKYNNKIINIRDNEGKTVLHVLLEAIDSQDENEYIDVVNILLLEGANIYDKSNTGMTSLHFAAQSGCKNIAEILIKKDAENAIKNLNFPIAEDDHRNNVKDFSKNDFIYGRDNYHETAFHVAARNKQNEMLEMFLQLSFDMNSRNNQGETVLHILLKALNYDDESNYITIVKSILSKGPIVNAKCEWEVRPLHIAAQSGLKYITEILIKNGADVHCTEKWNCYSPLHFAAENNHKEVVEILLKYGANVDAKQNIGKTALALATCHESTDTLVTLLKYDAYIETRDNNGRTPLLTACYYTNPNAIIELIEHGANINVTDNLEQSSNAIQWAAWRTDGFSATKILHFVVKLKVAGVPILESLDKCIGYGSAEIDDNLYDMCENELIKLKGVSIIGRTSLCDVLQMSENKLVRFLNNPEFHEIMTESADVRLTFPVYGSLILGQYRKGLSMRNLLEQAKEALTKLSGIALPDLCSERIFYLLDRENLRALINASRI